MIDAVMAGRAPSLRVQEEAANSQEKRPSGPGESRALPSSEARSRGLVQGIARGRCPARGSREQGVEGEARDTGERWTPAAMNTCPLQWESPWVILTSRKVWFDGVLENHRAEWIGGGDQWR